MCVHGLDITFHHHNINKYISVVQYSSVSVCVFSVSKKYSIHFLYYKLLMRQVWRHE